MDIPSLFMIPSAVSSGKVHSVFPNSTDADFDFNRDSSATRVNSQGLIETVGYFGSELVTNGDFSSGSSGWTLSTTPPELRGNSFLFNSSSNFIFRSWSNVSGRTYRINFQGTGNVRYRTGFSGSDGTIKAISLPTIVEFEATSNTNRIQIYGATSGTGVLDSVSIKEVTGDRARLNYEIEGGLVNTKPSLLLENQSTNLVTYSEDFSQWSLGANGFLTYEKDIVAPDGTLGVYRLKLPATGTTYLLSNTFSSSNPLTVSVFAKATGTGNDNFNLYTGGSNVSPLKTATDEWQKFEYTASGNSFYIINSGDSFVSDIYIWGAQAEALSYCTSYIPTNGSTQTRAAETCNGAGTSSIFESSEGILYAEIAALANSTNYRVISISDGTTSNVVRFYYSPTANRVGVNLRSNSANVFSIANLSITNALEFIKIAVSYKLNNFKIYINGTQVQSYTSGNIPIGLNELAFDNGAGNDVFYGKIRDIRVYNTKEMTDSEVDILLTKITS